MICFQSHSHTPVQTDTLNCGANTRSEIQWYPGALLDLSTGPLGLKLQMFSEQTRISQKKTFRSSCLSKDALSPKMTDFTFLFKNNQICFYCFRRSKAYSSLP
ncbi:hypothetical protein AMECASPLE_025578, partial [Ameca splendens]